MDEDRWAGWIPLVIHRELPVTHREPPQVDERYAAAAGRTRLCRPAVLTSGFLERALLAPLSFGDMARYRVRKPSAESVGERGSQRCAVPVR